MLQRNVSGGPLILPTLEPPAQVFPGETIEHDEPLAGFEIVSDEKSTVAPVAVTNILHGLPPLVEDNEPAAPSATTDEEASK